MRQLFRMYRLGRNNCNFSFYRVAISFLLQSDILPTSVLKDRSFLNETI